MEETSFAVESQPKQEVHNRKLRYKAPRTAGL